MNPNKPYYLKKNQRLLWTSREAGSEAIIDYTGESIGGHWADDKDHLWSCMKHEFSKIFTSKKPR